MLNILYRLNDTYFLCIKEDKLFLHCYNEYIPISEIQFKTEETIIRHNKMFTFCHIQIITVVKDYLEKLDKIRSKYPLTMLYLLQI